MERVKEQKGYPCQKKGENNIATLGGHKLEGAIREAWGFEATLFIYPNHGLRTLREETAFTARPEIQSQSQIFRFGRSIFCLPHRPNFSDIFDLCLHWVSVVRGFTDRIIAKKKFHAKKLSYFCD